jgi:hypothetical protein
MHLGEFHGGSISLAHATIRSSADPCVAARHVIGRLLDLWHINWRTCVADLLADHNSYRACWYRAALPNLAVFDQERRLAAPLARPPPGSALGRPPGTGAPRTEISRRSTRFIQRAVSLPVGHLPRLPLSSSQAPRLGRPPGVAARWLRQPRRGTHSQGFGACEEDGSRPGSRAGGHNASCCQPCHWRAISPAGPPPSRDWSALTP